MLHGGVGQVKFGATTWRRRANRLDRRSTCKKRTGDSHNRPPLLRMMADDYPHA